MSNTHTFTKRINHSEFVDELVTAGVTAAYNMNNVELMFHGSVWDAMDEAEKTAELALVATSETTHSPTTITEVTLATAPHVNKFFEKCLAVSGVTNIGAEWPSSYSGTAVLIHNSLTAEEQANLVTAAEAHDPSTVPSLAVDGSDPRVYAADGVATGSVVITDSRGAAANGKTVKVRIPTGGGAAIDGDSYVLAGVGRAIVAFQTTTTFTGELEFEAYYANGEADPVKFTVRRGTA